MESIIDQIDNTRLPEHVAVIMDGNGRWAKQHGKPRIFGHKNGVKSVREVTEAAAELGIKYLTLYAFSTENWNRPAVEVNALMHLLVETVKGELKTLNKNSIKLNAIGDLNKLPSMTYAALMQGIADTQDNNRMTLTLALNYSSRWEITAAVKSIANQVQNQDIVLDDINSELISAHMTTHDLPDPELLIRTSGEHRVSNYLLWQIAYTEFYFTDIFWPEFRKNHFHQAILDYQLRERRFGKTSEQLRP